MKHQFKAGTSKAGAAVRRRAFAQAYISNGRNGTQAAITAGYSAATAYSAAHRMLKHVEVRALVVEMSAKVEAISGLSAEEVIRANARIVKADPRKFYHPDGTPKTISELDDDSAAAISGVTAAGFAMWDKNRAIDMAMRHLGLYERDNMQRAESLNLQIVLVKPGDR